MVLDSLNNPQKNQILQSNLELLKSKVPLLYKKVQDSEALSVKERVLDEKGILSLTALGEDGNQFIFQSKRAEQNIVSLTSYRDISNYDVIIIEGFGLAEHIFEIIEASAEATFILIVEQSLQLFKEVINYIDLKPLFISRVSLSVNEQPFQAVRKRVEDYFGVYAIKDIKVFRDPVSIELNPVYYEEIDNQLDELSEVAAQNQETLRKFSGVWQRHILSNIKSVVIESGVNELFNKFEGVPTILVSAGPSLDKNINWIAGAQGKAIIMVVDTALKSLLHHGIKPDFVMSLDALEENYRHLEGVMEKEFCLIANPVVFPAIIKESCGPTFIMNFGDPLMGWIENRIGSKGETLSGGSIATSAFDLARKLGCSPVILVGQDLSYSGGRAYAEWGYFDRAWLDEVSKQETVNNLHLSKTSGDKSFTGKGIFDNEIYTSAKMDGWRRWFETMIKNFEIHCVNSTEDGLAIEGAEILPLKLAINKYCVKKIDVKETIASAKSNYKPDNISEFVGHLNELKGMVSRVGYIGKEGINVTSLILSIAENSDQQELKLNSYLQKMNIFAEQILCESEFIEINKWCIEALLGKMKTVERTKGKSLGVPDNILQGVRSYHVLFEGIDEMCSHYESKLDCAIGELKELVSG